MTSPVLTAASTVTCGHKGIVAVTGSPRLTVAGAGVLTVNAVMHGAIPPALPGCCISTPQSSPVTTKCLGVKAVTGGPVLRLTVGGEPVLAQEGFTGTTDGTVAGVTPQPGLAAVANQTFLTAG